MDAGMVSIITPCFNGEEYLKDYFESIIAQTYKNFELIFVDDGSIDDTALIAKKYGIELGRQGIQFEYIYQSNKGQAAAVNTALKEISGEYLMWMDADDIMYPDKIKKEVEFLENNKKYGFVQCWYEFVKEQDINTPTAVRKRGEDDNKIELFEDLINARNVFFSGIYLVRVDALKAVLNGFQIYEGREGQNWQLLLPLSANYKCGYVEEVLYKVVAHNNSHSRIKRSYLEEIKRNNGLRDILINSISGITTLEHDYKQHLLRSISIKYAEKNVQVAFENDDYEEWERSASRLRKDLILHTDFSKVSSVASYDKCYGCGTCASICPVHAIEMKESFEGFLFPRISKDLCVNCNQCIEICPVFNPPTGRNSMADTFCFKADNEIRNHSSSGGAFTALALQVIDEGGCICGCSFTEDFLNVEHIIINDANEIEKLQKSKYIQSYAGKSYLQVKKILDAGNKVLFVGTPCQVAGLNLFLKKDYENLLTIDFICHGVPSHKVWKKYLEWQLSNGEILVAVDFRDDSNKTTPTLKLLTSASTYTYTQSEYYKAFGENITLRKSCGHCNYPYHKRQGDVTIGDFWGLKIINPDLYDDYGCSVVISNSDKGQKYISMMEKYGQLERTEYVNYGKHNAMLTRHVYEHPGRNVFYNYLDVGKNFLESYRMAQNEMYDFGLITWWYAPNYGAALTAFALYEYISDRGYSVIMPDVPDYILKSDKESRDNDSPTRNFIKRYCTVGERYKDEVDILHLNTLCKNYIVGSDQLWNYAPRKFNDEGAYYFLDFAGSDKGKVSYATSFSERCFRDDIENIKPYIKRFDAVSVREESGVRICKEDFGVDATFVVDPVFLIDADRYKQIASSAVRSFDNGYAFVYMMRPSEEKWAEVLEDCQRENKKIIYCTDLRRDMRDVQDTYPDSVVKVNMATVEEWLALLINADSVYTDSYHGVCMSILMQKKCVQLSRSEQAERFDSLYNKLHINGQIINVVDYEYITDELEMWKSVSKNWLNQNLSYVSKKEHDLGDRYKDELQLQWKMIRNLQYQIVDNRKMLMKVYLEGRIAGRKVVIRGGGKHTEELMKLLGNNESIIGIWDPQATRQEISGIPCFKTWEDCYNNGVDAILVSSYKFRSQMVDELSVKCLDVDIIEPYIEWERLGLYMDREFYRV